MVKADDRLAALEQLRDLLCARLQSDDGSQTAALARQYRETLRDIDDLKKGVKKGSLVDELAKARDAKRNPAATRRASPVQRRKKSGA